MTVVNEEWNDHGTDGTGENLDFSWSRGKYYEIHVKGQLDSRWSDWLEGLEMTSLENGETVLSGYIIDQAALMGVLNKISRLNLALLSVNEMKKDELEEK